MSEVIDLFPAFEPLLDTPLDGQPEEIDGELSGRIAHILDGARIDSISSGSRPDAPVALHKVLELARGFHEHIGEAVIITHHADMTSEHGDIVLDRAKMSADVVEGELAIEYVPGSWDNRVAAHARFYNHSQGARVNADFYEQPIGGYRTHGDSYGGPFFYERLRGSGIEIDGVQYLVRHDPAEFTDDSVWPHTLETATRRGFRVTELLVGTTAIRDLLEKKIVNDAMPPDELEGSLVAGTAFYNGVRGCLKFNNELIPDTPVTQEIYRAELARLGDIYESTHQQFYAMKEKLAELEKDKDRAWSNVKDYRGTPSSAHRSPF